MTIVDSHCHVSTRWYEPVESLLFQMDAYGVEQAVLVQIQGQFDNSYQTECVEKFPGRFASVVIVDTDREDASAELERLSSEGAAGVRFKAATRSPGDDELAIWRTAERLGMPVSCVGSDAEFSAATFTHVVRAVPDLRIVVEHLGSDGGVDDLDPGQGQSNRGAFELAHFPNVYMKVSGLGEFCRRTIPVSGPFPFDRPIPPLLEMAYEAFGAGRLMWGSDFPPVSFREGYGSALRLTTEEYSSLSDGERDLIFGGVAKKVFGF